MDGSHNGEPPPPGTEDVPEGFSLFAQNEESSQTVVQTEETEPKPMEILTQNLDYYAIKQGRKSPTPPRREMSRSPARRASVCKSPVRRRRSRSPIRRKSFSRSPIRRKRSRSRDKSTDSDRSPKHLTDLDYYGIKQRRKSPTPPRRIMSRSPARRASVCKSPVRRRRSRSSIRRKSFSRSPIRRKRSRSRDNSTDSDRSPKHLTDLDYYSIKQRRKSRTPPRRKMSRSPARRASVCKSPVRRRRSRSPIRRKSFSRSPIRRNRSRSRDKSTDSDRSLKRITDLDKTQLLEIAKANAAAMCANAGVPLSLSLKPVLTPAASGDEKITNWNYGSSIQELTENPSLNPAPKTQETLTKEFPVSSGSWRQKKASNTVYGEWAPLDKNAEESKDDVFTNTAPAQVLKHSSLQILDHLNSQSGNYKIHMIATPRVTQSRMPMDIISAMNERAVAQSRLTGNPYDIEALYILNRSQEQIDAWVQSTSIPGQFTGSTGAQVLSAEEISNSGPQAWLKKDQFLKATPVSGGCGTLLMRKMDSKEGEELGRNNEGNVNPILPDFKTYHKGLVADGEKASHKLGLPAMKDLSGKHPISALLELCTKKKWPPPDFDLVEETGPIQRRRYLFRVTVNGVLCQPSQHSISKKLAKATAAAAALQTLGVLPKESMTSTSNFCTASTSTL